MSIVSATPRVPLRGRAHVHTSDACMQVRESASGRCSVAAELGPKLPLLHHLGGALAPIGATDEQKQAWAEGRSSPPEFFGLPLPGGRSRPGYQLLTAPSSGHAVLDLWSWAHGDDRWDEPVRQRDNMVAKGRDARRGEEGEEERV